MQQVVDRELNREAATDLADDPFVIDEAEDDWLLTVSASFARDDLARKALRRLTRKAFLGALTTGAAAGGLGYLETGPSLADMIAGAFFGMLAVLMGGFVGGLGGAFTRALGQYLRTRRTEPGDTCLEGTVLGGFAGAFIGLIVSLVLWKLPEASLAAGLGAMAGAFVGALPGQMVGALLGMLAVAEWEARTPPDAVPEHEDLALSDQAPAPHAPRAEGGEASPDVSG